jgi:TonB family protein
MSAQDRLMLPWSTEARESRTFRLILGLLLSILLVFSIWLPLIELPEPDREEIEKLPPQLARLVKPPVELPKPEPKKEEVKAEEPKKEEPKKEEPKPKKDEPKPVEKPREKPKSVQQAREVAQKSGLLAQMDDLADMRSSVDMSALKKDVKPRAESTIAAKANALNAANVVAGSGGIRTDSLATPAERVRLDRHDGTELTETVDEKALARAEAEAALLKYLRSNESIMLAAERIKGTMNKLYQRELRKDPFLEGKVVLEVVIEPGGEVSACRLVSSELNHSELEAKFVSIMKLFNFGAEEVAQRTVNLPFTFTPS